ncbi:Lrp/AsnC family transcriptional regulator [Myxococcus sp. K15C18031901]|uniref:Lrp/AsnC family transcriptional regulator n=1 Tax=Myxococcus dinghuensis TaxID=2906761 RepID=UPI0020A76FCF|nr:Lrp/AsnC family transcriptional regulator [Myxococcus dinghuensis]MCP3097839.1 Lrp/AsnC family transcriptional regulator [Myxococcus dinghuensis]
MDNQDSQPPRELDSFDRAILRIIQRDNRTPQRVIAEAVHLSTAAVQRRIAAMEKDGVILRNAAIVDPDAIPLTITAIVEVYLHDEKAATIDRVKAQFRDDPEVQQCYYVTGGTSFALVIVSPNMKAYAATARRLFEQNEAVARYRTLIALERVKTDTQVLIP